MSYIHASFRRIQKPMHHKEGFSYTKYRFKRPKYLIIIS